jgi:hypothetical protein
VVARHGRLAWKADLGLYLALAVVLLLDHRAQRPVVQWRSSDLIRSSSLAVAAV